jgi:hypothetical protein
LRGIATAGPVFTEQEYKYVFRLDVFNFVINHLPIPGRALLTLMAESQDLEPEQSKAIFFELERLLRK